MGSSLTLPCSSGARSSVPVCPWRTWETWCPSFLHLGEHLSWAKTTLSKDDLEQRHHPLKLLQSVLFADRGWANLLLFGAKCNFSKLVDCSRYINTILIHSTKPGKWKRNEMESYGCQHVQVTISWKYENNDRCYFREESQVDLKDFVKKTSKDLFLQLDSTLLSNWVGTQFLYMPSPQKYFSAYSPYVQVWGPRQNKVQRAKLIQPMELQVFEA